MPRLAGLVVVASFVVPALLVPLAATSAMQATPPASKSSASQGASSTLADARARMQAGDHAGAAKLLERLTADEPQNAQAWHLLGLARHMQGDLDRALAAHLESAKFPATAATGHYNAACVYARKNQPDRAFQELVAAEATGNIDLARARTDDDLKSLAKDPRWLDLLPTPERFAAPFVEPVRVVHEWSGEAPLGQFGWIARNVGDLDHDGAADFVTSAPTVAAGGPAAGRVYVYSSRSGALLWQKSGQPGDQLGLGVEAAGDVDGDGTPDVIAGAPGRGRAFVWSGKDGALLHELVGDVADSFGQRVSDAGDVDGDGCADVLVGAAQEATPGRGAGRVTLFSGRTGTPLLKLEGARGGDRFGSACAGWSDGTSTLIVVGAPEAGKNRRGEVSVFDATGERLFVIEPDATGTELGAMFVSVVGDVDGDGFPDVYASDWMDGAKGPTTGRVYVHSGVTGERLLEIGGERAGDGFGIGPADVGDVDGDGHADLLVGEWQHAGAARSGGRCRLFSGAGGALLRTVTCQVPGDTFGFDATGLGDVDGDGAIDYLVTSAWSAIRGSRSGRLFVLAGTPRRKQ